jgi:hypothetical protein
MIDEDDFWSNWWNEYWQGKPKYSEKTYPSATLSTTKSTWQTRSRTPNRSGGKPATNHLNYGAAFFSPISSPLTTRRVTVEVFDPASTRVDYLSIYGSTALGCFFSFLILYTVGRTPWTGDQSVTRSLPMQRTTQTQNIRIKTSIPWVRFERTIPEFETVKTVHALDRAATANGN